MDQRSNSSLYARDGNIDLQFGPAELKLQTPECGVAPLWDEMREMSEVLSDERAAGRDF